MKAQAVSQSWSFKRALASLSTAASVAMMIASAACSNGGGGGGSAVPVNSARPGAAGGPPAPGGERRDTEGGFGGRNGDAGSGELDADGRPITPDNGGRSVPSRERLSGGRGDALRGSGRPPGQRADNIDLGNGGRTIPLPRGEYPPEDRDAKEGVARDAVSIPIEAPGFNPHGKSGDELLGRGQGRQIARYPYGSSISRESLFYSTNSEIDLYRELDRQIQQNQGPERFERNRSFAYQIGATKLIYAAQTREVELAIRLRDSSGALILRGRLDYADGRAGIVREVGGSAPVSGQVHCLDADGGCTTAFVKVLNGAGQVAYFISRNAPVYVMIRSPVTAGENSAYGRFISLFTRSQQREEFDRALSVRLHSTEVIGGTSHFLVAIRGFTSEGQYAPGSIQAIGIEGALVKEANSERAGAPTRVNHAMAALGTNAQVRSQLSDSIGTALLEANNGRGTLQLLIPIFGEPNSAPTNARLLFSARQSALSAVVRL